MTLNSNPTFIGVDGNATLTFNGQFVSPNTNNLNKLGLGTFGMTGSLTNGNTGTITINDGTFRLNKLAGVGGTTGPTFVVGDNLNLLNASPAPTDTLELASPEQLATNNSLTINSTGLLRKVASASPTTTQNEVQSLQIGGTAGTFQVTFNGGTTAPLPFNIPATGAFFQAQNETQIISNPSGNQNGGFRITFQGQTQPPTTQNPIFSNAPATGTGSVQSALEAIVGVGNVSVAGNDGGPYIVRFIGNLANKNLPNMTIANVNIGGVPNFQLVASAPDPQANDGSTVSAVDGGVTGSPTATLEMRPNSLPTKPTNITFDVAPGPTAGNYLITMTDSNSIKTDQPALLVSASGGATASIITLIDGGSRGGYGDTESITSLTMVEGASQSAAINIAAGATISLGGNVTGGTGASGSDGRLTCRKDRRHRERRHGYAGLDFAICSNRHGQPHVHGGRWSGRQ